MMYKKGVVVSLGLLFILFVVVGCLTVGKTPISNEDAVNTIAGIWVNTEYSGQEMAHPQKVVFTLNGIFEEYAIATNTFFFNRGKYIVKECWIDSRGNLYCTVNLLFGVNSGSQELWRLDETGEKLEMNWKYGIGDEFPKRIDKSWSYARSILWCLLPSVKGIAGIIITYLRLYLAQKLFYLLLPHVIL
jgi:hypothetical protein